MDIIKASGKKEKFRREKIYRSLKRVGADPRLAQKVSKQVTKTVGKKASSERILREVTLCLKREDPILAARYNLKRAIMELGPAGFLFEKYVSEVLRAYGYLTQVGRIVRGFCVNHEIDVIAQKEKKYFMIECKYHNRRGIRSDLKVALYTFARFLDIKKAWEKAKGREEYFNQVWLVTNTKCTSEAIRYAKCQGLKIISWRYPKEKNLEQLIERKGLYPITILPSLSRYARQRLSQKKLILAQDILKYSSDDLVKMVGLRLKDVKKLQKEAEELCMGQ